MIDPNGVPHIAEDVKTLTAPWPAGEAKIYVTKQGQMQLATLAAVAATLVENINGNTTDRWHWRH